MDTIIIALGNPLLSDEGIGIHLLRALEGRVGEVELAEVGTAGMRILHLLPGMRKAIFLDCAMMDAEPGTLRRFTPDDVDSRKVLQRLSLHEGDLLQILEIARTVDALPPEVIIFGIQPADVSPSESLSHTLTARLPEYVAAVLNELDHSITRSLDY
ncbi:MAG: hydrogenase maturation protease [Armatimonadota bacterium]